MDYKYQKITIEYIRSLDKFTERFLCNLKDNIYNIKFRQFSVRDLDSGYVLFDVNEEENNENNETNEKKEINGELEEDINDASRCMKYHLGPEFLDLRNIGTSLTFSVGDKPLKDLVMIERHYFKNKLIKSFEFKFDFCIPNSVNNWETIYNIPEIDEELKQEMIDGVWETKSDSFYFVNNKLIMHHKAEYNYSQLDDIDE
jgi:hypothetical protein